MDMKVLYYPDYRLIADNKPLTSYTQVEATKVEEMFKLMYRTGGIGLAAPQVGWNVKLFILNITGDPLNKKVEKIYYNPVVKHDGSLISDIEGCLSFPGINAQIKRHEETTLEADTPAGHVKEHFVDLGARAVQHEMDHIEGMLFIERMTQADLRRNEMAIRALRNRRP
jgi:peptide deformylase